MDDSPENVPNPISGETEDDQDDTQSIELISGLKDKIEDDFTNRIIGAPLVAMEKSDERLILLNENETECSPLLGSVKVKGRIIQPEPYFIPNDPMDLLAGHDRIHIIQTADLFELFTGFETCNKYRVFDEHKKHNLFFAKEVSDCCVRQMCTAKRPFQLAVMKYDPLDPEYHKNSDNAFMTFQCPFRLSFFKWNRARMYIKSGNPAETESSSPIGSVLSPFKWCNIAYSIVDENQKPIYFITGDRFQPSICCRCPCDPFKNVEFEIRNVENTETVGLISKRWNGCGKEFCTDSDDFTIDFPRDATPKQKMFIFAAVILLDFMHFECETRIVQRKGGWPSGSRLLGLL
eukprot:TRINITY_DN3863_c0_g2_i1.p1 TRINITY_DN3863_c0_g2~~TRINITY_DN3863_c0_g2_i1.p1  ORF type:complete len:348 (-),score=43.58 TRINITY_DN3863_c0_g2_i1:750-1793(-)